MEHDLSHSNFSSFTEVSELYDDHSNRLNNYIDQLLWWNNKVNLVSRDVSRETIRDHIRHSLTIYFSDIYQKASKIIDAGSGGGLPGIPLSIIEPKKKIILNDIVTKKMMACKQMILKLELQNCHTKIASVKNMEFSGNEVIITKHAFKINELFELIGDKKWRGIIMLKGEHDIKSELVGISDPLKIQVKSLEQKGNSFYDGKALVEITR